MMRKIFLITLTFELVGCAYDPFGFRVTDEPGFGFMYIIGGVILLIVWIYNKFN